LLWVRAAGKQSKWRVLSEQEEPEAPLGDITLGSSEDVEVSVLGRDGQPVPGAIVTERADFGDWPTLSEEEREARQFEFLPESSVETDALGKARLPVLPARAWIRAKAGGLVSAAWTGIGAHKVTLRLYATCEIEGRVLDENGAGVPAGGSISCQARHGHEGEFLALAPVRAGGTFGPVRLPIASEEGFRLRYFGGDYEAVQTLIGPPAPDSRMTVELHTRAGLGVNVHVVDEEKRPIAGVNVTTQWLRDGNWNRIERRTNAEGRARLKNLPTGQVYVRLRKPGFVPNLQELFRAETWVHFPLEVQLERAASVEGTCTRNGHPVASFMLYFWNQEPKDGGKLAVESSEDGGFRIDEVKPGQVQLLASSKDVVQSALATLTVPAGGVGHAALELPEPRTVAAQVIDASTGEGVGGARATALVISSRVAVSLWGAGRIADGEGRFELSGFGNVEGRIRFEADGYARREFTVPPLTKERTELGRIALHRVQELFVRVHSGKAIDFTSYGISLQASGLTIAGQRLSTDGTTRLAGVSPGMVELSLEASDGSTTTRTMRIRPGIQNVCEFELDGQPLDIDVIPAPGRTLPESGMLVVTYFDSHGAENERAVSMPSSGSVHVDGIDATRVFVQAFDEGSVMLAASGFELDARRPRHIKFSLNPMPQRLRVLDESGTPIPGASVALRGQYGVIEWWQGYTTDMQGEALVADWGPGEVFARAYHLDHGSLPCSLVTPEATRDGVIELVISTGGSVEIELRDGAELLPGTELELRDACGASIEVGSRLADADGHVHLAHISLGDYRVIVDQPGLWPASEPIRVSASSRTFTLQLRRLGSARVRVRSSEGKPLAGVAVDLVDQTSGARVADWVEKGDVPAPQDGLRTDSAGQLVVHALPRGTYRCSVVSAAGESIEQQLVIPPFATGEVELRLP